MQANNKQRYKIKLSGEELEDVGSAITFTCVVRRM